MANYIELDEQILAHYVGSSGFSLPSGYSSWIEYYKDKSNLSSPKCAQFGCSNSASLGAHVKIRGRRGIWIVPMCSSDNPRTNEEINVKKGTRAVKDPENG
ncbi:hypothetical protein [Helicobacter felis]|uniref:hypothetical protein n=1 Tax=Helicobacter felis TaxID=214 RepID=UPI000CF19972|nr:hypothetical protein [Helicobacter felis]